MVVVEVVDKRATKYKQQIFDIARWLLKKTRKGNFYLEIYLIGNKQMRKNVLAFPAVKHFPRPDIKQSPLGEIYLNPGYIAKEKFVIHHSSLDISTKLAYMLIHGFLHLLGYDHLKKNDRIAMERKEKELLEGLDDTRGR